MEAGWSEGPLVYVAGSYDHGDKPTNLQRAFAAAENVVKKGGFPVVPHMCHLWHSKYFYHKRDFWLLYSMRLLKQCHCMIVCPGSEFSEGVKAERREAMAMGIPVLNYDQFMALEKFPPLEVVTAINEVNHGAGPDVALGQASDDVRSTEESVQTNAVDQEDTSDAPCLRDECGVQG